MTFVPDCFSIILLDIDGSLVLVSCTTISVYVNLSKNVLPMEPCLSQPTSARECLSHLRVQRYNFSENYQNILLLFFIKKAVFTLYTLLYYIRARDGEDLKDAKKRKEGDGCICRYLKRHVQPTGADAQNRLTFMGTYWLTFPAIMVNLFDRNG